MAVGRSVDLKGILLRRSVTGGGALVAAVATIVSYVLLASSNPGAALVATSASAILAVLLGALFVWPMESKITWQRQLEVFGFRIGAGIAVYVTVGLVLLFATNQLTEHEVPLEWPVGIRRRLPFWPFYLLVVVGCQGLLPTPPGAC